MRFHRALLVLPLAVLIASASPGQKRGTYSADLDAFFKEAERSYPFFDVKGIRKDWKTRKSRLLKKARSCKTDADFIVLAADALRGLRDGHAGLTEIRPKLKRPEPLFWPWIVFLPATKKRVVIAATGKDLQARLPRGTVVDKIDGRKARTFLDERGNQSWKDGGFFSSPQRACFFEYRQALSGERGEKHELVVRTAKGKRKVNVRAQHELKGWLHLYNPPKDLERSAKSVWHTALEGGVGYVWLRRMDRTAEGGVGKAIAAHASVKAWIFDLRGNTGGGYDRSFKQLIVKLGRRVAVIVDAGAISAAETFTRDLVNVCRARVFGSRTAGSSSSKKIWKFPSGVASVRFSVKSRTGLGGRPLEFHGIEPDVSLEADPEDVAAGRNTEILAALAWLRR